MRLTESRLRRIIRDVIAESMSEPDSYDEIMADLKDFRDDQETTRLHNQRMDQLDAEVDSQQKVETMMNTLNTMNKSVIRDKVSGNAHLTGLAEALEYDYDRLRDLAKALVESGISIF